jgi:hypothetical protein
MAFLTLYMTAMVSFTVEQVLRWRQIRQIKRSTKGHPILISNYLGLHYVCLGLPSRHRVSAQSPSSRPHLALVSTIAPRPSPSPFMPRTQHTLTCVDLTRLDSPFVDPSLVDLSYLSYSSYSYQHETPPTHAGRSRLAKLSSPKVVTTIWRTKSGGT